MRSALLLMMIGASCASNIAPYNVACFINEDTGTAPFMIYGVSNTGHPDKNNWVVKIRFFDRNKKEMKTERTIKDSEFFRCDGSWYKLTDINRFNGEFQFNFVKQKTDPYSKDGG